ncbi:HU family DNA-binding protein [Candidatus Finniella inopinata]|uniref:HU family DNA-binding protein n=1 Tax=Candidatus Finniella inopinata TaxID=1696036 RepID=A0A4Q7DKX0_9PROT|nr:HU family DNA-binding protein [Candidatus Finniella inopinata]RZI45346.1 HU family DNA-binding protein [Candidatus Finniella inopinata]
MNKSDLIVSVANMAGIKQAEAKRAIDAVFDSITGALKNNEEVRLIGFGTFVVTERPATEGRNPRTGEKLQIAAKRLPKFRPGKELKEAV